MTVYDLLPRLRDRYLQVPDGPPAVSPLVVARVQEWAASPHPLPGASQVAHAHLGRYFAGVAAAARRAGLRVVIGAAVIYMLLLVAIVIAR